ncbi:MAG: NAD(P)/FAD-dependent oxidoreductase [Hyphomonadaceae bacterium]|nr:NAD(P)/FAD-dependent oxidoreductase [Hyphomonadaceae bacterium]
MGKSVVVIGAGPMGLAAAYHAVKRGFDVDVLEAGDTVGGMAAHFDFNGVSIERFYHFCCLSDHDTFAVMEDLGIGDKMRWVSTRMGYYVDGELHRWGDPVSLLMFPKLSLLAKIRYGLQVFTATRRSDWRTLDRLKATDWFLKWSGREAYDKMWKPLLDLKFYEFADQVSAAWMWQRIKRLGRSRKSLFEERLGYIEGGSETLMNALAKAIKEKGGRIHLMTPAQKFLIADGQVTGVEAGGRAFAADQVISTAATPIVAQLFPDDQYKLRDAYARIRNIGVICVLFRLKKPVTDNFWVNISDKRFAIPGIVEFSNLRPVGGDSIVYVPFYMPITNPKFIASDEALISESMACLKALNPALAERDVIATHVARLRHAQPIYEPGFEAILPPVQTPIAGLQIADTCYYYPEDRGVSESLRFAKLMAERLNG